MLTDSYASAETTSAAHAPIVHVSESANGGWDIRIEHEGEAPVTEHYSDWHRLERRQAILALPPPDVSFHHVAAAQHFPMPRINPHAPAPDRAISH